MFDHGQLEHLAPTVLGLQGADQVQRRNEFQGTDPKQRPCPGERALFWKQATASPRAEQRPEQHQGTGLPNHKPSRRPHACVTSSPPGPAGARKMLAPMAGTKELEGPVLSRGWCRDIRQCLGSFCGCPHGKAGAPGTQRPEVLLSTCISQTAPQQRAAWFPVPLGPPPRSSETRLKYLLSPRQSQLSGRHDPGPHWRCWTRGLCPLAAPRLL